MACRDAVGSSGVSLEGCSRRRGGCPSRSRWRCSRRLSDGEKVLRHHIDEGPRGPAHRVRGQRQTGEPEQQLTEGWGPEVSWVNGHGEGREGFPGRPVPVLHPPPAWHQRGCASNREAGYASRCSADTSPVMNLVALRQDRPDVVFD